MRPTQLRYQFETLLGVYEPAPTGQSLPALLRSDWDLFHNPAMDDAHAKELLAEILDDGEIVRKAFAISRQYEAQSLSEWDELREELIHGYRWFVSPSVDLNRLKTLLSSLHRHSSTLESTWYRARIPHDDQPIPLDRMGAPPRIATTAGRANPAGIPYLYLGSTMQTAVAEVRPHAGDSVFVAEFSLPDAHVIDLRAPRRLVSPFMLGDEDDVGNLLAGLPLLDRLGDELTHPVPPRSAAFEYAPSQYLCEFIKSVGFDGVLYRSFAGQGSNLALFDVDAARASKVQKVTIEGVDVRFGAYIS